MDFLVAVRHHFAKELTEDEFSLVVDENHLVSLPSIVAVESVDNNVLVDTILVVPAPTTTLVLISGQSCALDDSLESELGQDSSSLPKHEDGQQCPVRQTHPHEVEPHFVARASEKKTMFSNLTDEGQGAVMIYEMDDLREITPSSTICDHGDLQSYAWAWVCTIQQFEPKAVFGKSYIQTDGMEDRIFDPGAFVGFGIIQILYSIAEFRECYRGKFCQSRRKKYIIGAEHYQPTEEVEARVNASIHCATQTSGLVRHANVIYSHCSLVGYHQLWIIMSYMAGGFSMGVHPDGFEEIIIGKFLREVLKGIDYLHQQDQIHWDDVNVGIRMGNFDVSAYLFDAGATTHMRSAFVGAEGWFSNDHSKSTATANRAATALVLLQLHFLLAAFPTGYYYYDFHFHLETEPPLFFFHDPP